MRSVGSDSNSRMRVDAIQQRRVPKALNLMMKSFVLLLVGISPPAWAAWVFVASSQGASQYVDPETIRKTQNGRRAWNLMDYANLQRDSEGESYRSEMVLSEFDCAGESFRSLQISYHSGRMGLGGVVWSGSSSTPKWRVVAPGSIGEVLLKSVCSVRLD